MSEVRILSGPPSTNFRLTFRSTLFRGLPSQTKNHVRQDYEIVCSTLGGATGAGATVVSWLVPGLLRPAVLIATTETGCEPIVTACCTPLVSPLMTHDRA